MPANVPARTPPEVLRSIELGSKRVSQLATELSNRVTGFEEWLNTLPGRIETMVWLPASELQPSDQLGLHLHRSGKRWMISVAAFSEGYDDPDDIEWKPLNDATVQVKLVAVRLFPQLLDHVAAEQAAFVKKLESARDEFDKFAAAIGAAKGKGA